MEKTTFFSPPRALAAILKLLWGENPDFSTQLNNNIHSPRKIPGKLHHEITPNDYTTAEAKWRIFYRHFLHSPYMKTTLQSVRIRKNGWSVLKCISLLMRWKIRHARERCYYTPLVRKSPVMESSIIILNSFNGNFYFSNPARNNNPVRILVMQYKTLQQSLL